MGGVVAARTPKSGSHCCIRETRGIRGDPRFFSQRCRRCAGGLLRCCRATKGREGPTRRAGRQGLNVSGNDFQIC